MNTFPTPFIFLFSNFGRKGNLSSFICSWRVAGSTWARTATVAHKAQMKTAEHQIELKM